MAPTLVPGDRLLADTAAYLSGEPKDGDIIVFSPPLPELGTAPWIKRIIASPGDRIAIHRGHLIVNGNVVSETYVQVPTDYELEIRGRALYVDNLRLDPARTIEPIRKSWSAPDKVPSGYFIVLGDNRNNSDDSHLWGFLPRGRIIGKVVSIYWPISHYRHF